MLGLRGYVADREWQHLAFAIHQHAVAHQLRIGEHLRIHDER